MWQLCQFFKVWHISEYTTASVYAYYPLPIGHVCYSIISLPIGHSVSYKNICMLTWGTVGLHYLNFLVLYLMVMCLGRGMFWFQMWMFFDLKLSSKYGWKLTVEQISSKIEWFLLNFLHIYIYESMRSKKHPFFESYYTCLACRVLFTKC